MTFGLPYTSYTSGAISGRHAQTQFDQLMAAQRILSSRYLVPSPRHHKCPHQYQSKDPLPLQPSCCCVGKSTAKYRIQYQPPIGHLHYSPILNSLGVGHDVVQLFRQEILQGSTFTAGGTMPTIPVRGQPQHVLAPQLSFRLTRTQIPKRRKQPQCYLEQ